MRFDKQRIIDLLNSRGEPHQAVQARDELPDQVDTDQHADLLAKFGINPSDLPDDLGGIAGKL